jgi:hypothetical protein
LPNEVIDLIKIIHIILKQKHDNIKPDKLIENLFTIIMPRLKIDTLSKNNYNYIYYLFKKENLFLNVICHNLILTNNQNKAIISIIENDSNILNPAHIIKICKPASYLTFILHEIYEFINKKTENGVSINFLRKCKNEYSRIKMKLERLNHYD